VLSIAGPLLRLDAARMHRLAPALLAAAVELSASAQASPAFTQEPFQADRGGVA
jgi:IclR family acetate operon transcriptional repressor